MDWNAGCEGKLPRANVVTIKLPCGSAELVALREITVACCSAAWTMVVRLALVNPP